MQHPVIDDGAEPLWAAVADQNLGAQRLVALDRGERQALQVALRQGFFLRAIARSILRGCTEIPN